MMSEQDGRRKRPLSAAEIVERLHGRGMFVSCDDEFTKLVITDPEKKMTPAIAALIEARTKDILAYLWEASRPDILAAYPEDERPGDAVQKPWTCQNCGAWHWDWYWEPLALDGKGAWVCTACGHARNP